MNKKGFTLVELLAVIVILAIIMIIATMNVGKVITSSRTQAFESNMDLAVKNAKRILETEGKLDSDSLKESLNYNKNEYDFAVTEMEDGYILELISKNTGKFKNVDCNLITKSDNYECATDVGKKGRNKIAVKINKSSNLESLNDDEIEIVKQERPSSCTSFDKKENYELGDAISFCNYETGKSEDFYVISDNGDTVTALAKYNLMVGEKYDPDKESITPISSDTKDYGLQSEKTLINYEGRDVVGVQYGAVSFCNPDEAHKLNYKYLGYWTDENGKLLENYGANYPADVYEKGGNILIKTYVNNYINYIKNELDIQSATGTLITHQQLINLGCKYDNNPINSNCSRAPAWLKVKLISWTGSALNNRYISMFSFFEFGGEVGFNDKFLDNGMPYGVRPVITVKKSEL